MALRSVGSAALTRTWSHGAAGSGLRVIGLREYSKLGESSVEPGCAVACLMPVGRMFNGRARPIGTGRRFLGD